MGKSAKRMRKVQQSDISSSDDDDHHLESVELEKYGAEDNHADSNSDEDEGDDDDDDDVEEEYDSEMDTTNFENEEDVSGNDSDSAGDDDGDDDNESDDDGMDTKIEDTNNADMEELEKEYNDLRHEEQDLFRNLRHDQDDDLLKGQAVKNQREPIRSCFCETGEGVEEAYSDLIDSSKKTLDSILKLQEALVEKNPAIMEANDDGDAAQKSTSKGASKKSSEGDEEWFRISQMQSRISPFRDMSVDKWQRKTQVTSGAAGIKNKFQAFNQNISEQVASYMRDPSRMIKGMQQMRSVVPVFGNVLDSTLDKDEVINADADPELLDDSEFYQQLLREFFETVDTGSSETAFYAMKRLQTKKRKIVDRRASKSRKIRYHIHEKIVNFMAPEPANIPPMAPKLFENLFGLKTQKSASVA